jgi:hypothetical protein
MVSANAVVAAMSWATAVLWTAVEDAAPVAMWSLVAWDEVVMACTHCAVAVWVYCDAERLWRGVGVISTRTTWAVLALVASDDGLLRTVARIRVVIVRVAVEPVDACAGWRGRRRYRWWRRWLGAAIVGFLCTGAVRSLQGYGVRHHAREALRLAALLERTEFLQA